MSYRASISLGVLVVTSFTACGGVSGGGGLASYEAAVRSGFEEIPPALEMEQLFGEADHFITHYGFGESPLEWNSEVYFWGRYSLTMQVNVELESRHGKIARVVDEPKFYFVEYTKIWNNGHAGKPGDQHQFGIDDWKKMVAAKGDFSAIGITAHRDRPVPDFDKFIKAIRDPRMRVRPDSEESK